MSLCPNLRCRSPPAISCWFYLPVVPIALPVEKKNGARLQQRVHSWLEDKTLPDCKYKHGAGGFLFFFFFSGLRTLTLITDEQSKSSRKKKNTHQNQTPVCSPLKSRFGLMRLLEVLSLHGLFLWHGKSGDYPNAKVIYLAVHPPLGLFFFGAVRKRVAGPYCVS